MIRIGRWCIFFVHKLCGSIAEAARRGLGAAAVSSWIVREDLESGRLVNLLPDWKAPTLPVYVIYPQARQQSPKLRRFVETIRELAPAALQAPKER